MIAHERLALIVAPHVCLASHVRLYVCWFLKPMIKAVAVPSNATTVKGTAIHFRLNTWYRTVDTMPKISNQKMSLLVQIRNSKNLYDLPICIIHLPLIFFLLVHPEFVLLLLNSYLIEMVLYFNDDSCIPDSELVKGWSFVRIASSMNSPP